MNFEFLGSQDWAGLALGVLGFMVSGIVGNAAWDFLKPHLTNWRKLVFRLLTLNRQKSRDRIYIRAAMEGSHAAGKFLVWIVLCIVVTLGPLVVNLLAERVLRANDVIPTKLWEVPNSVRFSVSVFIMIWAFVFMISIISTCLSVYYTVLTVVRFDRLIVRIAAIAAPEVIIKFRERFAAMKNEADYDRLMTSVDGFLDKSIKDVEATGQVRGASSDEEQA